jgi:large subunit ribosomal protein L7/L12
MASSLLVRSTLRRSATAATPATRFINNQLVWPPPEMKMEGKDNVQIIFEKILFLDLVEVSMLNHLVQKRLGYKAGSSGYSPGGGSGGGAAAAAPVEPVAEKTLFELKLISFDAAAKIKVIKEVRAIAGLGLKEAKELVEGAPKVIQKDIKKEVAEELKKKLEEVGAVIEIA